MLNKNKNNKQGSGQRTKTARINRRNRAGSQAQLTPQDPYKAGTWGEGVKDPGSGCWRMMTPRT